jgi:diacylglycerol kinase family enzyme
MMRRVALIYNPASGQLSRRRVAVIEGALGELRRVGVEAEALETNAPGSARTLARAAARQG